jgi:hypothetical protein
MYNMLLVCLMYNMVLVSQLFTCNESELTPVLPFLFFDSRREIDRIELKSSSQPPTVLAGELCAPEQSCRTASRVLSRMSNLPVTSPVWEKFNGVLASQLSLETEQDGWFLRGTSVQVGC